MNSTHVLDDNNGTVVTISYKNGIIDFKCEIHGSWAWGRSGQSAQRIDCSHPKMTTDQQVILVNALKFIAKMHGVKFSLRNTGA